MATFSEKYSVALKVKR